MRKHLVRISVALLTFLVGVLAATVWLGRAARLSAEPPASKAVVLTRASDPAPFGRTGCTLTLPETPEQKAVRLAEEFVARNGYTDLPADREHLSYESIEWESNVDEMLKQRHDSLERKAYGIYYAGRGREKGWTVVFKPTPRGTYGDAIPGTKAADWGRAVTMNEDFQDLLVEHKNFNLRSVHKKF